MRVTYLQQKRVEDVCLRMGSLIWFVSALVPFVGGRPALDVQFSHVLDVRKPVTPSTSALKDCIVCVCNRPDSEHICGQSGAAGVYTWSSVQVHGGPTSPCLAITPCPAAGPHHTSERIRYARHSERFSFIKVSHRRVWQ